MSRLAIDGGQPYRAEPFPRRTPFGDEEVALVTEAIRSQSLFGLGGPKVTALETEFAGLYGVKHAVGSTSGTSAIHIAIGTVNPNPGDEIITAPITDGGSVVPIIYQNCIPIFADVDETYNIDPDDVERNITDRTAAIMVVHLFGNACHMEAMVDIARRHNIPLIEDCSQAHATKYKGRYLGTWGDLAAFSLQQSKHMTTGDGGMTITNRDDWAERMMLFRDKGWTRKPGWGPRTYAFLAPNYRMTELHGAVGLAQVKKVRSVVERRIELGSYLTASIRDIEGITPAPVTPGSEHSYWAYPLRVDGWPVARFAETLTKEGVGAGAFYIGEPIFLCMEALAAKKTFGNSSHPFDGCHGARQIEYTKGMCPRTEDALQHIITLGFHEEYTKKDIEDIAGAIHKVAELLPREV
ncbi:MAG: DegT/DnrJ/EryC1/StrS family aminotransferase [Candidatus Latescibacteria bacterium]|nr:DegT/DnrJ/EryC1/StrS family aminotransferase [Candidatus Latescibacterota bacterium]